MNWISHPKKTTDSRKKEDRGKLFMDNQCNLSEAGEPDVTYKRANITKIEKNA